MKRRSNMIKKEQYNCFVGTHIKFTLPLSPYQKLLQIPTTNFSLFYTQSLLFILTQHFVKCGMFFSHLSILEPLPSTIRHDRPLLEIDSNARFEALRESRKIWENLKNLKYLENLDISWKIIELGKNSWKVFKLLLYLLML